MKVCTENKRADIRVSVVFTASELQSMQVECNGLQKECSVLRSEKQDIVGKHQKERSSLQSECASLRAEKEELVKTQQKEKANLQSEYAVLRSENEALLQKQKQLEKDLTRSELRLICLHCAAHHTPLCLSSHPLTPVLFCLL